MKRLTNHKNLLISGVHGILTRGVEKRTSKKLTIPLNQNLGVVMQTSMGVGVLYLCFGGVEDCRLR